MSEVKQSEETSIFHTLKQKLWPAKRDVSSKPPLSVSFRFKMVNNEKVRAIVAQTIRQSEESLAREQNQKRAADFESPTRTALQESDNRTLGAQSVDSDSTAQHLARQAQLRAKAAFRASVTFVKESVEHAVTLQV